MAIDPKELRIGNIVSECEEENAPEWYQVVTGIVNDDVYLTNGDIEKSENLYPVKITKEELLRVGFFIKKGRFGNEYHLINFSIYTNKKGDFCFCWDNFIREIKYFHHLQNLYFDLTGEELVYEYDA